MNLVFAMFVILAAVINLPKLGNFLPLAESAKIAREANELANSPLLIGSDFSGAYDLALKRCERVAIPCTLLRERRQEIADGFASCRDESEMCQAVRTLYQSSNYSVVFAGGKPTVELSDKPYSGQIGNVLLDEFAAREDRLAILLRWSRYWAVELLSSSLVLLVLAGYCIRKCSQRVSPPLELKSLEKIPDDDLAEWPKLPELERDPESIWWERYNEETTLSPEELARFGERFRKSGILIKRSRDENWSPDRLNLEFIAAGLIDDRRTVIAILLVAGMREKFEQW
ncbi:MAG: hypothetical protein WA049_19605 [Ferribacterium limneticum]